MSDEKEDNKDKPHAISLDELLDVCDSAIEDTCAEIINGGESIGLYSDLIALCDLRAENDIPKAFDQWLEKNITIWLLYERLALSLLEEHSMTRYSSNGLLNAVRFHSPVRERAYRDDGGSAREDEIYKISCWVAPYLARLFVEVHPVYKSRFLFKKVSAVRDPSLVPPTGEKKAA